MCQDGPGLRVRECLKSFVKSIASALGRETESQTWIDLYSILKELYWSLASPRTGIGLKHELYL